MVAHPPDCLDDGVGEPLVFPRSHNGSLPTVEVEHKPPANGVPVSLRGCLDIPGVHIRAPGEGLVVKRFAACASRYTAAPCCRLG